MRVAIGASVLVRGRKAEGIDGIGRYTDCLMRALQADPACEMLPYVFERPGTAAAEPGYFPGGNFQSQALPALLWGRPFPAMQALHGQVELVHATDHLVPRMRGLPVVATVMDAIPLAHPEWVSYRFRRIKNALWRRSIQWADHVITISEHARRDVVRWFGVPAERVSVIPLGVERGWFEPPAAAEIERVRRKFALPERYFLFVGTIQPRKNLERLIAAHRSLPDRLRRAAPLLVAGRYGWGSERLLAELKSPADDTLRWLCYVPENDLAVLLKCAHALTLPSLHEGFGLPVFEALAAGVPVLTSSTTALPEVAGDAALLVDPEDIGAIGEGMRMLVNDDRGVAELRIKGPRRAAEFTWERVAEETRAVYRRLV